MDWTVPPTPAVAHPAPDADAHEVIVPAEEQDEHHTWVNLEQGIVHLALPPERLGSAWDAEPRAEEQDEGP